MIGKMIEIVPVQGRKSFAGKAFVWQDGDGSETGADRALVYTMDGAPVSGAARAADGKIVNIVNNAVA